MLFQKLILFCTDVAYSMWLLCHILLVYVFLFSTASITYSSEATLALVFSNKNWKLSCAKFTCFGLSSLYFRVEYLKDFYRLFAHQILIGIKRFLIVLNYIFSYFEYLLAKRLGQLQTIEKIIYKHLIIKCIVIGKYFINLMNYYRRAQYQQKWFGRR